MTQAQADRRGRPAIGRLSASALSAVLGLIPCVFLVALVAFQLLESGPNWARSSALVTHTYAVLRTANVLVNRTEDAERGQRGFLLTGGREEYLDPYNRAVADLPGIREELRALVADNATQQGRLAAAYTLLDAKLAELARSLDAFRRGGADAASRIVETDEGMRVMRSFLEEMGEFQQSERALLATRLEQSVEAEKQSTANILIGSVVAIVSLATAGAILFHVLRRVRQSELTLRTTIDNIPLGVAARTDSGTVLTWNERFLGDANIDANALAAFLVRFVPLQIRGRQVARSQPLEEMRPDGRTIEYCVTAMDEGGFIVTSTDITERLQAEAFRAQAGKMRAIGQMTGGIAHDFNNLLTVVMGSLERLADLVRDNPKARRNADMAMLAAERGARLNRQLLAFARRQPLAPTVINPSSVLSEIMDLLRRTVGERVEVEVIRGGGEWNTQADRAQLESAILNLVLNARDAMPDGGKLTIETGNAALDDAYASRHAEVAAGQYVMIAVTDTGEGMTPDVVAQAFDPFFTTKAPGQGSGLGLSQIYGFVKQTGGHVKIYTEPGHGTTVRMYLPRSNQPEDASLSPPPPDAVAGDETVLVVEDEGDVRATVVGMLNDLGYRVLEASDGAQALSILEAGAPIDLLFTDVVMPGAVTSNALVRTARELRPGLKVLFTSGYTENSIIHQGRLDPGVQLLSKPYRRDELASKLRSVLAK